MTNLDSTDKKILACLSENARTNASAISEKIGMSVSAVIERIKKLEASGLVKGYTVILDGEILGRGVSAFIDVSTEQAKRAGVIERIEAFAEKTGALAECYLVTGNSDFIMRAMTSDTKELERLLLKIQDIEGVVSTRTAVVMKTVKEKKVYFE